MNGIAWRRADLAWSGVLGPLVRRSKETSRRRASVIRRTGRPAASVLLVAALTVLAGCGGGSHPSVASLAPATTTAAGTATAATTTSGGTSGAHGSGPATGAGSGAAIGRGQFAIAGGGAHLTQLAACMRSHGEPSFPDPNAQGVISSSNLDPSSPQFQQAMQACQKFLPNGGNGRNATPPSPAQQAQMRQQALAFSACMRKHGVPGFPDPQFSAGGRVTLKISVGGAIDPGSAQFQAAQQTCRSDLPGAASFGAKTADGAGTSGGK